MTTGGRGAADDHGEKFVAIYHVVLEGEGLEESAQILFQMLHEAQELQPGRPRKLFLDIDGHRNAHGEFDGEMLALQQDFVYGFLRRYVTEIHCPLGTMLNPAPQQNELPGELQLRMKGRRRKS
jgi:hypothetical protein